MKSAGNHVALDKKTEKASMAGNTADDKQVNVVIVVGKNWRRKTFVVGGSQKTRNWWQK